MKTLPFCPLTPGIRTLWVIQFKGDVHLHLKPSFDFFIPSPFNRNDWVKADQKSNRQALDILQQINRTCSDIKQQCQNISVLKTFEDYLRKVQGVFTHMDDLDILMKDFNDLIKRLSPPPSKETGEETPGEDL